MRITLKHIFRDRDRHGNERVYVRSNGRKIRMHEAMGSPAFMLAYQAAIEATGAPPEHARIKGRITVPGSLGALAVKYFGSRDFLKLDPVSQGNRRRIIEECLQEKITEGKALGDGPAKLFNASHMRWLMELKEAEDLFGAANNRRKYFSTMLSWAVQQSPPLVSRNAARDVKVAGNPTDGFHTWTEAEFDQYLAHYPIGTKGRLAVALLAFTGLRRSDVVRIGPQMVQGDAIVLTPKKTEEVSPEPVEKPILPDLAEVIAGTSTIGLKTFLVTEHGNPFTAAGFGNWFRDRCNEAGLPQCSAHGLRKAAACRCADSGATLHDLMKLFDWKSPAVAIRYIQKADKKRATARTIKLLSRKGTEAK